MLHCTRKMYARGYAQRVFFLCTPNTRSDRLYGVHVGTIVKTRRCARRRTAVQYASLTNAAATTVENIKNDENETIGVHTMVRLALVGRTKEHCVRGGRGNEKNCTRATEKSNDYNGRRTRENGIWSKIRVVIIRVVNTRDNSIETSISTRAKLDIFIRLLIVILHTIIAKLRG